MSEPRAAVFCFASSVRLALAAAVAVCAASVAVAEEPSGDAPPEPVTQFLASYCLDCHSADYAEGEREFASFALPLETESQLIAADEIIDQVTLRAMPPEDAAQPSDEERVAVATALRDHIAGSRERFDRTGGRTVMRRLSTREYESTLAALFDRRVDTLGLTVDFPQEATSEHLDTIGESLVTSGFLLDLYFQAANRLVELRLNQPPTETQEWRFTDNFRQYEELTGSHKHVFNYEYLCLYEQPNSDTRQGGYGHIEDFLDGVPVSGVYEVRALAQAMHRDTHYDPKIFGIDFDDPFELAVVPGDVTKGHIHYPQTVEPILGRATVPDDEPQWLAFTVFLEAGQTPRFIFPNGPYESRASILKVNQRYSDEFEKNKDYRGVSRTHILKWGALPHIRIGEVTVRGPLPEEGGSREERAVFGPNGFDPSNAVGQLEAFASRAFRRPLEDADRDRIAALYRSRVDDGATPRQAALDAVKLILCSPSFLYLQEVTDEDDATLDQYALASRLSYALWSAPPDDALFDAAARGELATREQVAAQVERLLGDPRSAAFVAGFLDSWLNLRDLGNLPPPRQAAPEYYAEALPEAMKREVHLLFRHLIDTDGPTGDLLDADYTFADKRLAKLYQLPGWPDWKLADGFRRVDLPKGSRRGGLLGTAAVLTVSANGVDTSPVTRGVWVMENILGTKPPAPPDEVPSIADVSGATTIREKLALHSADPACTVCHKKIDPLGFALESFDPIGRARGTYPKEKGKKPAKVDPSGRFVSGEAYDDLAGFKRILRTRYADRFDRHLTETLLAHATGRLMRRVDRFEVEDILDRARSGGGGGGAKPDADPAAGQTGLRSLLVEALASQIVRSR